MLGNVQAPCVWDNHHRHMHKFGNCTLAHTAKKHCHPGAEPHVLQGHPPDAVCTWAADNGVDLLVAGAERGKMQRLLLGSFATHLARHASCDILLARPQKD